MQELEQKQFSDLLAYVDALEANYQQRISAMRQEYKQDAEELLRSYKQEKQRFERNQLSMEIQIEALRKELSNFQRLYQQESVQHKFTKDNLAEHRKELNSLKSRLQVQKTDL